MDLNQKKMLLVPLLKDLLTPTQTLTIRLVKNYLKKVQNVVGVGDRFVTVCALKPEPFESDPRSQGLPAISEVGVVAEVRSIEPIMIGGQEAGVKITVIGLEAVVIASYQIEEDSGLAYGFVTPLSYETDASVDTLIAYRTKLGGVLTRISAQYPNLFPVIDLQPSGVDLSNLPFYVANILKLEPAVVIRLIATTNAYKRYELLIKAVESLDISKEVDADINQKTDEQIQRSQREYVLRERAKALKFLLKEFDGDDNDQKYEDAWTKNADLYPPKVLAKIKSESSRLKLLGAGNQEGSVVRTYLDLLLKMPWKISTTDNDDINAVKKVLDEDHYGLKKQKERILEYLAVKTLTRSLKAPVLCLYGPPGVGKTSLAISVAKALNREFVKFALGGIYDESEIRGHRRTYIGALPGRIISGIAKSGTNNPVFLLDEIDKVCGGGIHGDPASALLELLDPEQNVHFEDNYLDLPFDMSNVLFICTANDIGAVPLALRDRLELIELNSYTLYEKLYIAKDHLIKQELKANGLSADQIYFPDESLLTIIDSYTREAGVRELRRKIGTIMRKFGVDLLSKKVQAPFEVTKEVIEEYLKMPIYFHTQGLESQVGVVNGLAYTTYGGEILPIECNITKGKGNLVKTGNLGDVMKESVTTAFSYVRALCERYGYGPEYFAEHDFHIHAPEGAVPKDGPSAGVALSICLLSAILNIPLRNDVAMTGEVDLRGNSMQIGGLREKCLGAIRAHIKTVLIPKTNHNDAVELPSEVRDSLNIIEVTKVEDVIPHIFTTLPEVVQEAKS